MILGDLFLLAALRNQTFVTSLNMIDECNPQVLRLRLVAGIPQRSVTLHQEHRLIGWDWTPGRAIETWPQRTNRTKLFAMMSCFCQVRFPDGTLQRAGQMVDIPRRVHPSPVVVLSFPKLQT